MKTYKHANEKNLNKSKYPRKKKLCNLWFRQL